MAKLEKLENNKVKLTFEVGSEKFEEGIKHAYNKRKSNINLQGFRKGKAPRKLIEAQFGKDFFFEDAVNFVLPEAYELAVTEHDLEVVSRPEIDVTEVSTETGVIITAIVQLKPEVTLGDYTGVTYKKLDDSVSDDEINKEIDKDRQKNARIISINDRPVQNDDLIIIDFDGSIGGIPFEGGKGEDYELKVGSHTFIDDFEEQLIGKNIGDVVNVTVKFPENYGKKELSNQPALFLVTIKEIKFSQLPDIDDEFAQDVSEFDTLEELKNSIREKLQADKSKNSKAHKENAVMMQIIQNSTIDLPQVMVDSKVDQMIKEFDSNMKAQGLTLEMYLQYMGQTIENMREVYSENAKNQVLGRLTLEAIALKENFEVTEEEFNTELKNIATANGLEFEQLSTVLRDEDREGITKDLQIQKALQLILETSIEEA